MSFEDDSRNEGLPLSGTTAASAPTNSHVNNTHKVLIFDGGTGREIERCGGPFRQPEWSALALYQDASLVQRVHESFLQAGARAITTNTYAIVPFHIGMERYAKDAHRLLRLAVQLAQQARDHHREERTATKHDHHHQYNDIIQILGSIPPLCGSYEPDMFREDSSQSILDDFLQVFCVVDDDRKVDERSVQTNANPAHTSPPVDVLLLETVGSLREAQFYLSGIHNYYTAQEQKGNLVHRLPVWLSFCVKSEYGFEQAPLLLSGERLSKSIESLFHSGLLENVQVLMINCCDLGLVQDSIKEIHSTIQKMSEKSATDAANNSRRKTLQGMRIGAYPNAFSIPPPDAANQTLRQVDYNISPDVIKCRASEWVRSGATVIGGCCGVNPDHIRAMAGIFCLPTSIEK